MRPPKRKWRSRANQQQQQQPAIISPPMQRGRTCFANAIANVIHWALKRIVGRTGIPSFNTIKKRLIHQYGINGASDIVVLSQELRKYRLQYLPVNEQGARTAVNAGRLVLASFRLEDGTNSQWESFSRFYGDTPTGILRRRDVGEPHGNSFEGHSVVLVHATGSSLTFLNSWGKDFASQGFFSIQNASVLSNPAYPMCFYDIFWTLDDLLPREIRAYQRQNRETKNRAIFNSIHGRVSIVP